MSCGVIGLSRERKYACASLLRARMAGPKSLGCVTFPEIIK
jgi:hypothetical protein